MDFLKDVWSGLVFACQWILHMAKEHPVVSFVVSGVLVYGWWLSFKKKLREERTAKRESRIAKYVKEIEELDLKTPGGLRSAVQPGEGDDPELVREAWKRYVASKTRGNVQGRLGGRY